MGLRSWGVGLCCLLAAGCAGAQAGLVVEHGTYSVRLLNHVIGTEDYTVRNLGGGQTELVTRSATNDRGSKRETTTTLRMMPGFVPASLTQESVPAGANGGVQLTVADGVATVREGALSRSLPAPAGAAAVFGATPAALQMMAMRTWLAHGRPSRVPVLRASAEALPLEIHEVGHEAIYARGRIVKLTRYTVANLVFGREIVWMNDSGRLAGLMTFAGGLPQEEILDQYEDVAGDLMHSGVRQEMLDLAELGRKVKPQMQGSYAIVGARLVDGTGAPAVENATVLVRDGAHCFCRGGACAAWAAGGACGRRDAAAGALGDAFALLGRGVWAGAAGARGNDGARLRGRAGIPDDGAAGDRQGACAGAAPGNGRADRRGWAAGVWGYGC